MIEKLGVALEALDEEVAAIVVTAIHCWFGLAGFCVLLWNYRVEAFVEQLTHLAGDSKGENGLLLKQVTGLAVRMQRCTHLFENVKLGHNMLSRHLDIDIAVVFARFVVVMLVHLGNNLLLADELLSVCYRLARLRQRDNERSGGRVADKTGPNSHGEARKSRVVAVLLKC